ncbi:MAG: hypothetical protein ACRDPE_05155 [Solirubrobacterales bacterium]
MAEPRKLVFWWDRDVGAWEYLFARRLDDEVRLCGEAQDLRGGEEGDRVLIVRTTLPKEAQEWILAGGEWQVF